MKAVKIITVFLHWVVIVMAALLIVYITRATLAGQSFITDVFYMKLQFWACMVFIFDILFGFAFSHEKLQYIKQNIFFLLVSVPYLNILSHYGVHLSSTAAYLLHFVPMIRAGYVLALITGVLTTSDRVKGMSLVYTVLMMASVYFCALVFFIEEHEVNPGVHNLWDALWWAFLDATTVGSNINSYTVTGQVLDVFLSAEGLILFPLFTVYITNIITRERTNNWDTPAPASTSESGDQTDATVSQSAPASSSASQS